MRKLNHCPFDGYKPSEKSLFIIAGHEVFQCPAGFAERFDIAKYRNFAKLIENGCVDYQHAPVDAINWGLLILDIEKSIQTNEIAYTLRELELKRNYGSSSNNRHYS